MTCTVHDMGGLGEGRTFRSRWFTVTQAMINAYADLMEDRQFIHVDPARAARTEFGGTVAHGFLTLSMLSAMVSDAQPSPAGTAHSVNYGFNRLRFLAPVRPETRVRGSFLLKSLEERMQGEVTVTWNVEVEIEGHPKPALVAEWIIRHYLA